MKITTPEEMCSEEVRELINLIEEQLKKEEKDKNFYFIVVNKKYSNYVYHKVRNIYLKANWTAVICKSASEKNENPELTEVYLWV